MPSFNPYSINALSGWMSERRLSIFILLDFDAIASQGKKA